MRGLNAINYLLPSRGATVQTLGHPAAGVIGWFDSTQNTSGVSVTQQTALTFAAVWCATRVIAETIATLPCLLYRRNDDDSRERASDDDRYWLVSEEPHPLISAVTFFESQTAQMVLSGNSYSKIVFGGGGVKRFEPRASDTVTVQVNGDSIDYEVNDPRETISAEQMLHVPGIGGDGITGWSVVKYAQQSIGSGLAADQYAGSQWGNGATPRGILDVPTMRLDKEARNTLRREWEETHKGGTKAGRIAITHGGMKFQAVSMSNEDAQFLESRQFSIREIARWFRLPPHMLADLADSSVRANIEQQALEFIVYSLKPWLTRWEQTLNRKLLTKDERRGMYYEFLLESLLRGDSAAQANAWSVGRQWGWWSVNEIRRQMNLPPIPGGDVYLQPSNMVPSDSDMAKGEKPDPPPVPAAFNEPEPEEEPVEDEDEPDTAKAELQKNWAESMRVILAESQMLCTEMQAGRAAAGKAMEQANESIAASLRSLRETRDEIRHDIATPLKTQVRGWASAETALVGACNGLLRDHANACLRLERAEVTKASKMVARGKNFIQWLEQWYPEFEQQLAARFTGPVACYAKVMEPEEELAAALASDYCRSHREQLLVAADGDPADFAQRIQTLMEAWQDDVNELHLREMKHVA